MMRFLIILCVALSGPLQGQINFLQGNWQGIVTTYGQAPKDGRAMWFSFKIYPTTGQMTGESRIETPFTKYYAYKMINGKAINDKEIQFDEQMIGSQRNDVKNVWCLLQGSLQYVDSTGYLKGTWTSKDCNSQAGELIFYRSKYELSRKDTLTLYHSWFNNLASDLARGWNAYYVLDEQMRNFEFVPVYFDHDKDVLKPEFEVYLTKMADIVNSHSDLRIKIIGNTDSNGSDEYNVELSERRAEQVQGFLEKVGVPADKIVIEYRGEKDPVKSNETPDGKRLNRRVDFEFI